MAVLLFSANTFAQQYKIDTEFTIPTEDHMLLDVYDLTGHQLSILVDKVLPKGKHMITWDATSYGAGMFLYRISSNNKMLTERIVKQK